MDCTKRDCSSFVGELGVTWVMGSGTTVVEAVGCSCSWLGAGASAGAVGGGEMRRNGGAGVSVGINCRAELGMTTC